MGRRSTRPDKNIYQLAREDAGLTREKASEKMAGISDDRIEKIESGKVQIRPDEVLQMSRCYKKPELCNLYCSGECAIGIEQVEKEKELLIEIAAHGRITQDEISDFETIRSHLQSLSGTVGSLNLWLLKQQND